jgi:hypothetical protein
MKEAGLKYIGIPWFEHKEIEYPGKDILALEADLIEICTKKVFY